MTVLWGGSLLMVLGSIVLLGKILGGLDHKVHIWTSMRDVSSILPRLLDLPVAGIGVDLTETPVDALTGLQTDKALLAGVADAKNTLLEDPAELRRLRDSLTGAFSGGVTLTPSTDLSYLPAKAALAKLKVLKEAVA